MQINVDCDGNLCAFFFFFFLRYCHQRVGEGGGPSAEESIEGRGRPGLLHWGRGDRQTHVRHKGEPRLPRFRGIAGQSAAERTTQNVDRLEIVLVSRM